MEQALLRVQAFKSFELIGEEGRTTTANVNTHEFRDGNEGGEKEQNGQ